MIARKNIKGGKFMRRIIGLCIILALGVAAYAETVNLRGTVSNQKGKPVAGAIIKLAGQNLADTTDSQGAYSLVNTQTAALSASLPPAGGNVCLNQSVLRLSLMQPSPVEVEIYDMRGTLLERAER